MFSEMTGYVMEGPGTPWLDCGLGVPGGKGRGGGLAVSGGRRGGIIRWFSFLCRLIFRFPPDWFFGLAFDRLLVVMTCSLKDLPEKVPARVVDLGGESHTTRHLMDLGLRSRAFVTLVRRLFFGNNYIIEVGDEHLVLRKSEAKCLKVTTLS